MSKHTGWAVKLSNGKFAHDGKNDVTPALFPTRRAAREWWFGATEQGSIVRVNVTVRAAKSGAQLDGLKP